MSHYDDMMRRHMDDATRRLPDPAGWTRIAELEHRIGAALDYINAADGGGQPDPAIRPVTAALRRILKGGAA